MGIWILQYIVNINNVNIIQVVYFTSVIIVFVVSKVYDLDHVPLRYVIRGGR